MILDLDAGNTRIKWLLRSNEQAGEIAAHGGANIVRRGCIDTEDWLSADCDFQLLDLGVGLSPAKIRVSSVLGEKINKKMALASVKAFGFSPGFAQVESSGFAVQPAYADLSTLGVDRWLAMLAAYEIVGGACVIVDAGSALTFDVLDVQGVHLGGYIVPGVESLVGALFGDTRNVKASEFDLRAEWSLGDSTQDCVANGLSAMFQSFLSSALGRLPLLSSALPVVLTGGDAALVEKLCAGITNIELCVKKDLVFDGLALSFG